MHARIECMVASMTDGLTRDIDCGRNGLNHDCSVEDKMAHDLRAAASRYPETTLNRPFWNKIVLYNSGIWKGLPDGGWM